ncbi:MAG: hypothetical protein SFZ03_10960 [Candidatus Melainabacteria bacterium]|nr:hypothetical protein [Candidatus Melainabacteria bacterium]
MNPDHYPRARQSAPFQHPQQPSVQVRVEAIRKPTISLPDWLAMGGGLWLIAWTLATTCLFL